MQDPELIQEFLVESHENLARLDQEMVELEKHPKDAALLASIFRTMHTIKGTCGFLAFDKLEAIAHHAENLLSQLREGQRELTPALVSLILESVDAARQVLASIETSGGEGRDTFEALNKRLQAVAEGKDQPAALVELPATVAEEDSAKAAAQTESNVRVGIGLLDKLMDLVGELVLTRNQILQFNAEREDAALNATSQRLNLITTELQEHVMKTRMQPIGVVWNKLPRVVRDLALGLGKQIRLEMDGAETELDRTIIESIKDPMVHLVRNACDHGIEAPERRLKAGKPAQGRLTLRAFHEGGYVNIEIADDGAGIDIEVLKQKAVAKGLLRFDQAGALSDREVLNLIFHPGLSLAEKVTNLSGRGVGMDVVRSNIEAIGGIVEVFSRAGEGTVVKVKIPLTLAIVPGLVISSSGECFIIPQVSLLELVRLEADSREKRIEYVHGTPVFRRRGSLLPLVYLNQVLSLKPVEPSDAVNIIVLQAEAQQFGLIVDGINDTQEIVVKPLSKQLKGIPFYAGSTIMGDGRVALILDALGIGQQAGVISEHREAARNMVEAEAEGDAGQGRQRLLVFRAGTFHRLAIPLSAVARLEEFPRAQVERAGGRDVVQYRERILPLISLSALLEGGEAVTPADPLPVIVFHDQDRRIGLVVDQFLDIAEEAVTARQPGNMPGLLGSAVVGSHVADFLDMNYVIRKASADWFRSAERAAPVRGLGKVLVADASPFSRGILKSELDMAGYQVLEAGDCREAVERLKQEPVDLIVADLALPGNGWKELSAAMLAHPEWSRIPVLQLAQSDRELGAAEPSGANRDSALKFEREQMLAMLQSLTAGVNGSLLAAEVPAG